MPDNKNHDKSTAASLPDELRPPCPHGCVDVEGCGCEWNQKREAWPDEPPAARSLDREKSQMQSDGFVQAFGLSVAQAVEIVTDLGIDPNEVIYSSGYLVLKGVGHDAVTR